MRFILFLLLVLLPFAARADAVCDDLWFTRNLVMDRGGYCFGSTLGQSVFGNEGCTGKTASVSRRDAGLVERLMARETEETCQVDTSRPALDLDDLAVRQRLVDLPVRDMTDSLCLGWNGPETPLRAGHSDAAEALGAIATADVVRFAHGEEEGWQYVTVFNSDLSVKSGGWLAPGLDANCTAYAG